MAANETEEVDVAKEFNLLPVIFETIQALQKTNDPQEFTKKVLFNLFVFSLGENLSKSPRTFLNSMLAIVTDVQQIVSQFFFCYGKEGCKEQFNPCTKSFVKILGQ